MAAGWANWHMCGLHELKGEAQRERHRIMTGQIMNWGQAELSALRACCGPPGWEASQNHAILQSIAGVKVEEADSAPGNWFSNCRSKWRCELGAREAQLPGKVIGVRASTGHLRPEAG